MRSRNPFRRKHHRSDSHVRSCSECASDIRREREYLARLREAAIPPASQDLTARLLERTRSLAMAPCEPGPAAHSGARVLALAAGSTAAAAGVLAAGVFVLAGDPLPLAGSAAAGSFVHQAAQLPADGRELSAGQLAELRTEGWACPELESMGFSLMSARATTLDGTPAVELRLSDGQYYARVLEQHAGDASQAGNALPLQGGAATADGKVWIRSSEPWTAVYTTAGSTFTYESDLPAERADDALPVLQHMSRMASTGISAAASEPAAEPETTEPVSARIQRGFSKIVQILTP